MVTLDSNKIFELGDYISNYLKTNGLEHDNKLVIGVTKDELRKIDEDLFYRNKTGDSEFIPSDMDVVVTFENVKLIFSIKDEE